MMSSIKSVPVASLVPWSQVCRMLDKVQSSVRDAKKQMLLKFIDQYRKLLKQNRTQNPNAVDTFFPALRVLLPSLDRERGAYGVKERKLADLYIRILGLKKTGSDAHRLINYRKAKSGGTGATGDFAEVAYYVLKNRCPEDGTLSLFSVDTHLTSIAEHYTAKNHADVENLLLLMLRNMTATEQKWLIRVLLKEMHLGIGQGTIFSAWHPDAKDYYDVTNSLEKVCKTLRDPLVRLHEIEVSLFLPFRPMLAERAVIEKVKSQMNNKPFYVETKFDGERSQIHKQGDNYKYFSRNGFDFTANFGATPHSGLFTPYIHSLFTPHVNEVILDGEIISWSKSSRMLISKGEHLDVKNLKEDGNLQVCFCAFDILFLNGKVLTNLPLRQRLDILKTAIHPLEGRVLITSHSEASTKEEVVTALNEAIDSREEGIILKDPDSVYRPASRKAGWIKVKPEYVDSLIPELDLLVIGGYYGKGRRHGTVSHFLLGVAVPPNESGGKPEIFHSLCRVGSGYNDSELVEILIRLAPNSSHTQPSGVLVSREKPDIWYHPSKSCVVEVRAAEIVKTDLYQTGVTLRFPRVEKVRLDKPWYDVLTIIQLQKLMQEAQGKLATKHYIAEEEEGVSPRKKHLGHRTDYPTLPSHFRPADLSKLVKKAELFSGLEMCIIGGGEGYTKQELETLVAEHGGTCTQHPGKKTHCIIATQESVRVNNYKQSGQYNIIRASWILSCVKASHLVIWGPLDAVFLRNDEKKKIRDLFDQFGDSYTEFCDADGIKRILDNMDNESWKSPSKIQMLKMDENIFGSDSTRGLFQEVTAQFVDGEGKPTCENHLTEFLIRLHGGLVVRDVPEGVVITHIIVPDGCTCHIQPSSLPGIHLVSCSWVRDCLKRKKLLEERHFIPAFVK